MPSLHPVETELTTAATDALLAALCLALAAALAVLPTAATWKRNVWLAALLCMAAASVLGAVAHGFVLRESTKALLWKPLYLALGVAVALVVVGASYDWWGEESARRLLPLALAAALVFFAASQLMGGAFVIFIAYEALGILTALVIYTMLAVDGTMPGAGAAAAGIALSLVAALVQVSRLTLTVGWQLDHNGLFHLVQMVAIAVMAAGIRLSLLGR